MWWLPILVGSLASSSAVAQATAAAIPQLYGPRVITLPYKHVPFVSSRWLIVQRERTGDDCIFTADIRIKRGELSPGYTLSWIVRAYDPDDCQALAEEGVVSSAARR